jgi:hypothetical protein
MGKKITLSKMNAIQTIRPKLQRNLLGSNKYNATLGAFPKLRPRN